MLLARLAQGCRQSVPRKHSCLQCKSSASGQHPDLAAEPEKGLQNFISDQPKSFSQGTKGWGGVVLKSVLRFSFTSHCFIFSLEWKVGRKGQAGPIPSLCHSAEVKKSRIWVIQVHLFFPFFWRDLIPTSPLYFTSISQEGLSSLSFSELFGHDPSDKDSWSPG